MIRALSQRARRARLLLAVAVIAASAASGTSSLASPVATAARACPGQLFLGPDPVDFVYSIRASGTSCATARHVARGSRQAGASFDARLHYSSQGFTCNGGFVPTGGKGHVGYRCTRHQAVITFDHN